MGILKNILAFRKNNNASTKKELAVGDYIVVRGKNLFINTENKEKKFFPIAKFYLYSITPTNGRYPLSNNFTECGKLPTTCNIAYWISEDDLRASSK